MDVLLPKLGSYVLAVSGGVDSMALLHVLQEHARNSKSWKLTIAHLDHGIRDDSKEDRQLVQSVARCYGLPFVYTQAELGAGTSEAAARVARYKFLRNVAKASQSRAIITAHHQDDVLETAIINILRGTGRKGLTALDSRHDLRRPLLHLPKKDIVAYAKDQGLTWREDVTNQDQSYLRNYVRHRLLPRFSDQNRQALWQIINELKSTNYLLDDLLVNHLHTQATAGTLQRTQFNQLPHVVAREVMASWLRAHGIRDFDSPTLERLVVAAKVASAGKLFPISAECSMTVGDKNLALASLER